jgi:hypothetical protein
VIPDGARRTTGTEEQNGDPVEGWYKAVGMVRLTLQYALDKAFAVGVVTD